MGLWKAERDWNVELACVELFINDLNYNVMILSDGLLFHYETPNDN